MMVLSKSISLFVFSCVVSIATLLLYNIPFFSYVVDNTREGAGQVFVVASLIVMMLALNFMMAFEVYKPVARSVEEGEKHLDQLVNAYDNTIRYTDFLLDSLINTLRPMEGWNRAMIFISDHGESLGENKLFMHGLPMRLAPKVQYEIPFLVWISEGFRDYKPTASGKDVADGELPAVLEQHYIFHSVLNLLSIQSPAYNPDYDIFKK